MKDIISGALLPFECFYAGRVKDVHFFEKQLHDVFSAPECGLKLKSCAVTHAVFICSGLMAMPNLA